jgi:hypothetical protein
VKVDNLEGLRPTSVGDEGKCYRVGSLHRIDLWSVIMLAAGVVQGRM